MFNYPKWKIVLTGVLCALGIIFCIPNLLSRAQVEKLPEWYRPMNLGLDLRGGSQLLLQVDLKAVVSERMNAVSDESRASLPEQHIGYKDLYVCYSKTSDMV